MTLAAKVRTSSGLAVSTRYDRRRVRDAILQLLNEPRLARAISAEVHRKPILATSGQRTRQVAEAALQSRVRFRATGAR